MERDYVNALSHFSVDALALVLFAQSQSGAPRVEHERRFNENGRDGYNPVALPEYHGSRARYRVKQPNGRKGLK